VAETSPVESISKRFVQPLFIVIVGLDSTGPQPFEKGRGSIAACACVVMARIWLSIFGGQTG
jgi:hypothetical protein